MRRPVRPLLLAALTLCVVGAAPALRGGWAILTVHDLPEAVVAGQPTTLTFTLRQHGEEVLAGRAPTVLVRGDGPIRGRHRVAAERTREPGVYRATFTPPEGSAVRLQVDTDFNGWDVELLPIAVRAAGSGEASLRPVSDARGTAATDRGRALFVAKGCVGCHVKADDPALADYPAMRVGPDLGGRSFPVDFLVQKMTDAASLRPAQPRYGARIAVMPQLEVSVEEARAIAGYLNARSVASRD